MRLGALCVAPASVNSGIELFPDCPAIPFAFLPQILTGIWVEKSDPPVSCTRRYANNQIGREDALVRSKKWFPLVAFLGRAIVLIQPILVLQKLVA